MHCNRPFAPLAVCLMQPHPIGPHFPAFSEKLDVLDHYVAWRQTHDMPQHASGSDGPFSFCSYPFLLNPRAKSKLLHTEARIQMDQTVAQSRLEQQSGGGSSARGARSEEECVVPNEKARLLAQTRGASEAAAAAAPTPLPTGRGPPGRRRAGQSGLRWLFNSLRTSDNGPSQQQQQAAAGVMGSSSRVADDERRMMVRQINGTSDGVGQASLWKQGSLNLPAPEESGFPATHPDMCILRIRRNHLLEVSSRALQGPGQEACLVGAQPVCDALSSLPTPLLRPTGCAG